MGQWALRFWCVVCVCLACASASAARLPEAGAWMARGRGLSVSPRVAVWGMPGASYGAGAARIQLLDAVTGAPGQALEISGDTMALPTEGRFGHTVSVAPTGQPLTEALVVSAPGLGVLQLWEIVGDVATPQHTLALDAETLAASDRWRAAMRDGLFALGVPGVGPGKGYVVVYRYDQGTLEELARITPPESSAEGFGAQVAWLDGALYVSAPDGPKPNGEPDQFGAVYGFTVDAQDNRTWTHATTLRAPGLRPGRFGHQLVSNSTGLAVAVYRSEASAINSAALHYLQPILDDMLPSETLTFGVAGDQTGALLALSDEALVISRPGYKIDAQDPLTGALEVFDISALGAVETTQRWSIRLDGAPALSAATTMAAGVGFAWLGMPGASEGELLSVGRVERAPLRTGPPNNTTTLAQRLIELPLGGLPGRGEGFGHALLALPESIIISSPRHATASAPSPILRAFRPDLPAGDDPPVELSRQGAPTHPQAGYGEALAYHGGLLATSAPRGTILGVPDVPGVLYVHEVAQGQLGGTSQEILSTASSPGTGASVAISPDQDGTIWLAASSPNATRQGDTTPGSVFLFERQPDGSFLQREQLPAPGISASQRAIAMRDGRLAITHRSAPDDAPAVTLYAREASGWRPQRTIVSNEELRYGEEVVLLASGHVVTAAAWRSPAGGEAHTALVLSPSDTLEVVHVPITTLANGAPLLRLSLAEAGDLLGLFDVEKTLWAIAHAGTMPSAAWRPVAQTLPVSTTRQVALHAPTAEGNDSQAWVSDPTERVETMALQVACGISIDALPGDLIDHAPVTLTGVTRPGTRVAVTFDGATPTDDAAIAADDGAWRLTIEAADLPPNGPTTLRASTSEAAASDRCHGEAQVTVSLQATTPLVAPTLELLEGPDEGATVRTALPALKVRVGIDPAYMGATVALRLSIDGQQVTQLDAPTTAPTATLSPRRPLAEGMHTIEAYATYDNGLSSEALVRHITVRGAEVIDLEAVEDGFETQTEDPVFTGEAPEGSRVIITIDDRPSAEVIAGEGDRWYYQATGLTPGAHTITVEVITPDGTRLPTRTFGFSVGADAQPVPASSRCACDTPARRTPTAPGELCLLIIAIAARPRRPRKEFSCI